MLGGIGVLVAWTGSALEGRWRPEASWIDRAGLALGAARMALAFPSGLWLTGFTAPYI